MTERPSGIDPNDAHAPAMAPSSAQDEVKALGTQPWSWNMVVGGLRKGWRLLGQTTSNVQVMRGLLVAILLFAAAFRFTGLDWDEHQHLHPDERFLTMVENSLDWPESFKQYLDSSANPLNPYNRGHGTYVYGLLPIALTKFVGQVLGKTGYDGIYLVGRALSGVMDMLCVLLVFLTGRRLYDARVGLLGALLLSVTVLNIQQSHYFTVDTATTLYVTLALYLAVRVAQGDGWGSVLGMAVAFGLAVASKISVLSFLLIIGLAYLLRYLVVGQRTLLMGESPLINVAGRLGRMRLSLRIEEDGSCGPVPEGEQLFVHAMRTGLSLILVLVIGLLVFRVAQPQAFTGPGLLDFKLNPQWKDNMSYIQKLVSGEIDYPPSHQWAAREPVWYMLKNQLLWGMGLPLGLTVWASWALMGVELYRKHKWAHLLPWVWMTFTFFYQSIQFVKTIRYLLPIYPTMALMAGYGLIWLWDQAKAAGAQRTQRAGRMLRGAALAFIILVMVSTTLWAVAFTSIYTRPVTRLTASRWIYANLPQGSTIAWEVWDDPLPLNVDGHNAGIEYRQLKMDLYWEDLPEKRQQLYDVLREAQYIALSSNRLYGSIPRLPARYPMTTRYYEALFSGELGFEPLVTFTSRPTLFGIEIVDDNADESFTVYDHPKVIIFKKRADFDMEQVRALFEGYELERIVRIMPRQVTSTPNNLMLSDWMWQLQRLGGTWSRIFQRESLANRLPTLIWLLAIYGLGLIASPIAFVAFRRLRDRGYILGKTLGMLLLGYLSWLLASLRLLPFTRATILGALGGLLLVSAGLAWAQRKALIAFVRTRWRLVLANEVAFLGFFTLFLLIRWANPDLWHPAMGGEKPMDLAYLNAIIKSTYFPPYDPWFAGGYINYYYYGWVIVATVIKLTGIVPWVAYNLVLPTFFALVAMGAASVVYNLIPSGDDEEGWFARAWRFGLVGACLVAVVGNLGELQLLLQGLQQLGDSIAFRSSIPGLVPLVKAVAGLWAVLTKGQTLPFRSEWWYWNASRIMQHGEINEFPFFTFLYADLHAHLTAMPFALLALGLATSFVVPRVGTAARHVHQEGDTATGGSLSHRLTAWWRQLDWGLGLQLTLVALTLGELWCNNSWDYPTYMGITLVAVAIGMYSTTQRITQGMVARFVLYAGYVVLMSLLFFRPFHSNFGLAYSSVEPWKGERTSLGAYLLIHGPALFILVSYSLALLFNRRLRHTLARAWRVSLGVGERRARAWHLYGLLVRCQTLGYEAMWLCVGGLLVVVLAALWAKAWVLLLALPLLALTVSLALARRATAQERFTTVLIAAGLALTLAVEYVVIKGDIGRMNTVFKFYLQVWIMWGIAGAVGLAYLVRRSQRMGSLWPFWRNLLTVLLISAALYPLFATQGKIRDRWDPNLPPSLDGMAYMTTARYRDNDRDLVLEHDRQAILWMQDHIEGSPVIAEANTPLYRWGNRVSIYTGLPTIIGWDWHQKQQRAAVNGIVVDWRLQDLRDLYNTHDQQLALDILQRYRVGYIYVGELEQAYYDPEGLAKFGEMVGPYLEIAYQQPPVTIYRVLSSGASHTTRARPERASSVAIVEWLQWHWIGGSVKAQAPEKRPSGDLIAAFEEPDLMLDRPVEDLPVLEDRAWNQPANAAAWSAVLCWWLVLQCIGLAVWPMVARAFGCFADRGYALSKGMGLLVVSYLVWIGSSMRLFANSPPAAWLALLALGACSFFLWRRQRPALGSDVAFDRRLVLVEEALFSLAFGAFVGLRILNPDLWQPWFGGEKMMEIAFLNAVTKSAYMPPYDPYFSGGYINYYYYGYFIVSTLVKLTGVRPEVAFNLAVPTFFALTVVHAFGLGYHLSGGRRAVGSPPSRDHARAVQAGLASGLFVAIMGNLSAPIQLLEGLIRAGGATFSEYQATWADVNHLIQGLAMVLRGTAELPIFDYWYRATRIIPFTINEFPFFSFLFADLHPHMMAIPFTLLAVALALALVRDTRFGGLRSPLRWLFLCIAVGALGVINTWDLPLFWGVLCVAMLYRGYRLAQGRGLLVAALTFFFFVLAALMLYAPFYAHYRAQYVGIERVPSADRSQLGPFLVIWGLFIFLILSIEGLWLTEAQAWRRLRAIAARVGWRSTCRRLWAVSRMGIIRMLLGSVLLAGGAAAGVYWVSQGMFVLALLALMLGLAACAWLRSGHDETAFLCRVLILAAVGTLLGVELVYMRDFLSGGEWRRMNTVFKFYTQVWVILGLACGSLFPWLWRRVSVGWYRGLWRGAFGILLAGSLLYTALAIPVRVNERLPSAWPPRGTLDGTAYMRVGIYYWPDPNQGIELWYEREAIEWLWENVSGTPVLVEAPIGFYREGGLKVTSYTGLPTLVGFHEREQRPWDQVDVRERDAEAIYTTTDSDHLLEILDRYQVRYIYVGQLERALYAEAGLAKFAQLEQSGLMERVFDNEKVEIFRVV